MLIPKKKYQIALVTHTSMKLVYTYVFLITYFHHNQDLSPKQGSEMHKGENNDCFFMGKNIKVQNTWDGKKFSAQTNARRTPNDSIKSSYLYGQTLMLSFAFIYELTKQLNFFSTFCSFR